MPLSASQRADVRAAFVRLAERNAGFTSGRAVTPEWWADQQMARLDGCRQLVFPRAYYEVRVGPWVDGRLWDTSASLRAAIHAHCRGA